MRLTEQLGGAEFDEVHERGKVGPVDVLRAFDAKDWTSEARIATETEKCAPTLSLIDDVNEGLFWVSAYIHEDSVKFVNQYSYAIKDRSIWDKLFSRTTTSPNSKELELDEARKAMELFSKGLHDELLSVIQAD
jgi:hypothetical protein